MITGAGGQIAYSLLFKIASGDLFGAATPIELHLLDLPDFIPVLKAVEMELQDCAFPLLRKVLITSNIDEAFEGGDCYFLIGAKPRSPGMERKDLLQENAKIFQLQGQTLARHASIEAQVLVVGNPCNTNCLITMSWVPNLPRSHFSAMMRLDQNRLHGMIAERAHVEVSDVQEAFIWGNHSSTQVIGLDTTIIRGIPIGNYPWFSEEWHYQELQPKIQKRGSEVLALRGKSSAASAAHAACGAMRDLFLSQGSFSAAVWSEGNPYGIRNDLIFSFPCRWKNENVEIAPDHKVDEQMRHYLTITEQELIEERDQVKNLLGPHYL